MTLIAVSKLQPVSAIEEALAIGLRDFGENYAQELRDKHRTLSAIEGLRWHAIGPVQTKNAKYVAAAASMFHAVDRLEVAQELARRRQGAPLPCLIEVNLAGEDTKAGVGAGAAQGLVEQLLTLPQLQVVGLTAMPPPTHDAEASRPFFRALAALGKTLALPHLSMGTTADFEVAVEEGATFVRVGTALFGERPSREARLG